MRINELLNHLKSLKKEDQEKLAGTCGTSVKYLFQIAYGHKPCREKMAIDIDKGTDGVVSLFTLRPDVDWKYVALRVAA